jgi:PEP-CTERM motif-containing protein
MNFTPVRKWLAVTAAIIICCIGFSSRVGAATILLDSSSQFLGTVVPPEPSSPSDEAAYINTLIDQLLGSTTTIGGYTYDRSSNSCGTCPDATSVGSVTNTSGATGDFGSGYTYLLGKYDGPNGGDLIWYVAGLTGAFSIPTNWGPDPQGTQYGISHWALFNPGGSSGGGGATVPEPASLLLFGLAASAAAYRARRRAVR